MLFRCPDNLRTSSCSKLGRVITKEFKESVHDLELKMHMMHAFIVKTMLISYTYIIIVQLLVGPFSE
jgi:hypothetical protein